MLKLVFLDTETNDITEKAMIQFAGIRREDDNGNYTEERKEFFIKTDKKINLEAMCIHHITPEILNKKGSDFKDVEREIDFFLKDAILVAHNADFDKEVLNKNGIEIQTNEWIDTYTVAYEFLNSPDMKHNLQYLRYYFDCKFVKEINPHNALSDVIVLKAVFYKLAEVMSKKGIESSKIIDEMIRLTKRGIIFRTFAFGKHVGKTFTEVLEKDKGYLERLYNTEMAKEVRNKHMINSLIHYLGMNQSELF